MADERICYRELKKYKYQLLMEYSHTTNLELDNDLATVDDYVRLSKSGELTLKKSYAWDGPSGPTIDTKDFMRGSLVHDGLYQLMRDGLLDHEKYRKDADDLLRAICKEDGMSAFRAWYVYQSVRLFGGSAAEPRPREPVECIWAPTPPPSE
jgi:hypothetical protein